MIGILILAHGTIGESLIHAATHVMGGRPPHLRQLGLATRHDPDTILPQAKEMVRLLDQGDGVLVMADICGASPCNVATKLIEPGRVAVVTGASLPMLVRALTYRNEPLEKVVEKAISGGSEGVQLMEKGD